MANELRAEWIDHEIREEIWGGQEPDGGPCPMASILFPFTPADSFKKELSEKFPSKRFKIEGSDDRRTLFFHIEPKPHPEGYQWPMEWLLVVNATWAGNEEEIWRIVTEMVAERINKEPADGE